MDYEDRNDLTKRITTEYYRDCPIFLFVADMLKEQAVSSPAAQSQTHPTSDTVISSVSTPQSDFVVVVGNASNLVNTEIYAIRPVDLLAINVWKNVDLSKTTSVRPDGQLS
jgi:protein involved in polysaccharide export with SLBB domain